MNILLSGNKRKIDFNDILINIYNYLSKDVNNKIFIDEHVKNPEISSRYKFYKIYSKKNKYELVISIGGDGAILSCVRRMKSLQIPILGIHIGNLGFLNHCDKNNYRSFLEKIFKKNKLHFTKHRLIGATFYNDQNIEKSIVALNDIVVSQPELSRLVKLDVYIGRNLLNKFNSDGIIFSTPLGSTAYSLSAGGPIISPDVDCLVITPVSPHTLSLRPIVLKSDQQIKILSKNNVGKISLSSDGQQKYNIRNKSTIKIFNTNQYALFVSIPGVNNYYQKLRKKIGWR